MMKQTSKTLYRSKYPHCHLSAFFLASLDSVTSAVLEEFGLPVKLVGTGEALGDMEVFDPKAFVEGVFEGT